MKMTRGEATLEILSTPTACSGVDGEVGSAAMAGAPRSLEQRTGEKEEAGWAFAQLGWWPAGPKPSGRGFSRFPFFCIVLFSVFYYFISCFRTSIAF